MNSAPIHNNSRKFDHSTALTRHSARVAGVVLAAVLSTGAAFAGSKPQQGSPSASASQQKSSTLAVQVVDPQGAVLPHAEVVLSRDKNGSSALQAQGTTDSNGRLQLEGVPEGEYVLSVSARYFLASKQTVTLAAQKTLNLTIQLKIDPKATVILDMCEPEVPLVQDSPQVSHVAPDVSLHAPPTPIIPAAARPGLMR